MLFKKIFYYYSIFYCYCLIYIWSWTFFIFLLLLCWELSCLLLESCPFLVPVYWDILLLVDDTWFIPVPVWEFPVFFERFFLSPSLYLIKYSAAPGTSYFEWMSIAYFSKGRQLNGFIKKLLNYLSTFFFMSSFKT